MKITINDPLVSRSFAFRKGDIIDTDASETVTDEQALIWLNAGIATAIKEPAKKGKRTATKEVS